jgi:hypothetical protein
MDSRELWERNAVLAEAFCVSDDQVAAAQTTLDEAQADRTRLLAAFAVTVGSDAAVARLLGLTEREVRMARRTVGKEDARRVAQHLLAARPQQEPGGEVPADTEHHAEVRLEAPAPAAEPVGHVDPSLDAPREPAWTPALDGLLVQGWRGRVDLQVLAEQIGADLGALLSRLQYLAAEGRLDGAGNGGNSSGRHRRTSGHGHLGHPDGAYGPPYGGADAMPVADPWPQGLPSFTPEGHWGFIPHQITETAYAGLA